MARNRKKNLTIVLSLGLVLVAISLLLAFAASSNALPVISEDAPTVDYDIFMPVLVQDYPLDCIEGISNGGFEEDADWIIPITEFTAGYTDEIALSGDRSLRTGITDSQDNTFSYSSGRQMVSIPAGTEEAKLSFWLYTSSSEPTNLSLPENPLNMREKDADQSGDAQLVVILDSNGKELERLLTIRHNNQSWTLHSFDLAHYEGETIQIYFGVYNNGIEGITSMFVDDVSLDMCQESPPDPDCWQGIANESFEVEQDWALPETKYPAAYSADKANSGVQSMRSGIIKEGDNRYSFSAVHQTVAIPAGASDATLNFWLYPMSSEPTYLSIPQDLDNLTEKNAASWGDVQLVIIYDTAWNELERLVHMRRYDGHWLQYSFDLSDYEDETITVYFDVINNGYYGVTSMYIDDVTLESCAIEP